MAPTRGVGSTTCGIVARTQHAGIVYLEDTWDVLGFWGVVFECSGQGARLRDPDWVKAQSCGFLDADWGRVTAPFREGDCSSGSGEGMR